MMGSGSWHCRRTICVVVKRWPAGGPELLLALAAAGPEEAEAPEEAEGPSGLRDVVKMCASEKKKAHPSDEMPYLPRCNRGIMVINIEPSDEVQCLRSIICSYARCE